MTRCDCCCEICGRGPRERTWHCLSCFKLLCAQCFVDWDDSIRNEEEWAKELDDSDRRTCVPCRLAFLRRTALTLHSEISRMETLLAANEHLDS